MSFVLPTAHAQWFADGHGESPIDWSHLGSAVTISAVAATLVVAAVIALASRAVPAGLLAPLGRLGAGADRVPRALGAALGLSLVALSATGAVWAPSADAAGLPLGTALLVAQALVGAWLLSGAAPTRAAVAVLALTAAVALLVDPFLVVQAAVIPAIAVALLVLEFRTPSRENAAQAVTSVRIGMGVALIAVALAEKLGAPGITTAVLESTPELNVLALVGVDDATFTLLAGCVEILFGVLLIAGVLPQVVALSVIVPFAGTLPLFGVTELIGHLPIYGALLSIAVLAAEPQERSRAAAIRPRLRPLARLGAVPEGSAA